MYNNQTMLLIVLFFSWPLGKAPRSLPLRVPERTVRKGKAGEEGSRGGKVKQSKGSKRTVKAFHGTKGVRYFATEVFGLGGILSNITR
jgi:hypothetical protein